MNDDIKYILFCNAIIRMLKNRAKIYGNGQWSD